MRAWGHSIVLSSALVGLFVLAGTLPSGAATKPAASQWSDVKPGSRAWFAKAAIDDVAGRNDWMRDFGQHTFRPTKLETRGQFARALVRAFASKQATKPGLLFGDLRPGATFYAAANVAVANGWMATRGGDFDPSAPVDQLMVSKALVSALGLKDAVAGANGIHLHDGTKLQHPATFGVYLIGRVIGLWRNHDPDIRGDSEAYDILPGQPVPRADVAYALHEAARLGESAHWYADQYEDLDVGSPSPAVQKAIEFGIRYVGYPYVYAGEWNMPSSAGYCCGAQLQGGFDCSGFTWWLLRAGDSVWNNSAIRGYKGWILPERSSSQMAAGMKKWQRISYQNLKPGDIMLYGSSKDPSSVYHVDTFIGNGWALDSGGNGVSIVRVASGWYRETFQYGRRLQPAG